jgi:hypothetical protein
MASARVGRLRRPLVATVALVAAGGAACSLVTSLDGLTTPGGDDAGSGDVASVPVVDAAGGKPPGKDAAPAGSDGEADAGAPSDASASTPDGASDASNASDAGPDGPYCASLVPAPLFCDDFDENTGDAAALAARWDLVSNTGGTATLSGGTFESPPDVMLITTQPHTPFSDCAGYKSFTAQADKAGVYTLSFAIYLETPDTSNGANAVLSALQLFDPSGTWDLQLEVYYATPTAQTLRFSENASPSDGGKNTYTEHAIPGTSLPVGAWTRVQMVLDLKQPLGPLGGNTATLVFDGNPIVAEVVNVTTVIGTPEIIVGVPYAAATTAGWTVRYDDVTFAAQ